MILWLLLPSLAQAQWVGNLVESDTASTAVVGAAIRQWGPTDEVFMVFEVRDTNTLVNEHHVHIGEWECNNTSCSSASFVNSSASPMDLLNDLRHDQYAHPAMAIKREGPSEGRDLIVTMRGRADDECDGSGPYATGGATETVTKYLDVVGRWWSTNPVGLGSGTVRMDALDSVCENAQYSFTRYDRNTYDAHAAYDWEETPDVVSGPTYVPADVFVADYPDGGPWSHEAIWRGATEPNLHYAPTFDFYDDGAGNARRVVAYHDVTASSVEVAHPDEPDPWNSDAAFSTAVGQWNPSIKVQGDRVDVVTATGSNINYNTCSTTFSVDCRNDADWTEEIIATNATEASVVSDGDRLFIVSSSNTNGSEVKVRTKCVGDPSWSVEAPRSVPTGESQMLYSGRPYVALNKKDNVLHVVFIENENGLPNEDTGDAFWFRRSYADCP